MKGKLIVFSAPSGSGKTTVMKKILKQFPDLVFSISATTRKKRPAETEAKDYFFLSEDEFTEKIKNDLFVEWEKFYGYYYGTLKSFVDDNISSGKNVIFEVDVKGAISIKLNYPEANLIYLLPPSIEELRNRLIARKTETDEDLRKRIERAELELSYQDRFDFVVLNDKLEKAINEVCEIVEKIIKGDNHAA